MYSTITNSNCKSLAIGKNAFSGTCFKNIYFLKKECTELFKVAIIFSLTSTQIIINY